MATKRKLMNGDEGEAKADVKKVMTETIFWVELLYDGVYVKSEVRKKITITFSLEE